mmetsp:Transcript_98186/g.302725  ORF Transcript_98186/g.302725 Transcript_98186/m.302725 type:complete len:276 (+) Transcript_98186:205-1032(+)
MRQLPPGAARQPPRLNSLGFTVISRRLGGARQHGRGKPWSFAARRTSCGARPQLPRVRPLLRRPKWKSCGGASRRWSVERSPHGRAKRARNARRWLAQRELRLRGRSREASSSRAVGAQVMGMRRLLQPRDLLRRRRSLRQGSLQTLLCPRRRFRLVAVRRAVRAQEMSARRPPPPRTPPRQRRRLSSVVVCRSTHTGVSSAQPPPWPLSLSPACPAARSGIRRRQRRRSCGGSGQSRSSGHRRRRSRRQPSSRRSRGPGPRLPRCSESGPSSSS